MLLRHFGHAEFRPDQSRVLESVFAGRDTLAVLPTGGGKSVCFQVPAIVFGRPHHRGLTAHLADAGPGRRGAAAEGFRRPVSPAASPSAEQSAIWDGLREGRLRLLYVSPERLESLVPRLRNDGIRPVLLAIDEAHCISEWGHDFRPSYRLLRAARYKLGNPQTIALTGSATPEVRDDIVQSLGFAAGRHAVHVGSFDRSNLWLGVVPVADERDSLRRAAPASRPARPARHRLRLDSRRDREPRARTLHGRVPDGALSRRPHSRAPRRRPWTPSCTTVSA